MPITTIRQVSQAFGISTRTLRYYEEVGLLQSVRQPDQAYRAYDGDALYRLKQILVLRALRLPLKQIQAILTGGELDASLALLSQHAQAVQSELDALSMIRDALAECMERLAATGQLHAPVEALDDLSAAKLARALSVPIPVPQKKEEVPMCPLKDVRIVYLPPATVCACLGKGAQAENIASERMDSFIAAQRLADIKPDFRVYGFNHPNGVLPDVSDHGYEFWITIPDDLPVNAPYEKKRFGGGLYAAHMIPIGAFEEWPMLVDWVQKSADYLPRWGEESCMGGLLEEHLNYINLYARTPAEKDACLQLDLLMPIQPKNA